MEREHATPKHCYRNVYHWSEENESAFQVTHVVHGVVFSALENQFIGHAWAESEEMCFDPTINAKYPKVEYYERLKIDPALCQRYSLEEANQRVVITGCYGPWSDGSDSGP